MKTINNLVVVKVPENVNEFDIDKAGYTSLYDLTNGKSLDVLSNKEENFKILGKLSELSEEVCSKFVEYAGNKKHVELFGNEAYWKNYSSTTPYYHATAKESLISLLQSHGVDTNKNILLIEKL